MTIHLFWFTDPKDNKYDRYQFSNQEIQKHFLLEFSRYDTVVCHHSHQRGRVTSNPDDILIGHPPWPPPENPHDNWAFDNGLAGPGSAHPNTFIVMPWAHAVVGHPAMDAALPMIMAGRGLFGMGGVSHFDENVNHAAEDTAWHKARAKLVRINMGCDARFLPFKDDSFPRTNGFLHVSSLLNYKHPQLMLDSLPPEGCTLHIGTKRMDIVDRLAAEGRIGPNVSVLGPINNDDEATNRLILQTCSFYLHCAREAQATAILENAARGLVPMVTARSGFSSPDAIYLTRDDPIENRRIIQDALTMSDAEYRRRSLALRRQVRIYHSWERICMQMYTAMRAFMAGQDVSRRGDDYS